MAVNQKASQADPTNLLPIAFTVVFSEPVTGLTPAGLIRTGTASGGTPTVAGSGATYEISVPNGLTNGTLKFAIGAGAAQDLAGNGNTASTSADNTSHLRHSCTSRSIDPGSDKRKRFRIVQHGQHHERQHAHLCGHGRGRRNRHTV